ncbi:MAG: hypothetical protein H6867_03735 [Rhodospirillales bacterium]|nr:hypothetical protein [Rhodospirillales bacterium]MCB9996261.1 hypothetical protein [Rhodospirillales bacterium]
MAGLSDILCDVACYGKDYFKETEESRLEEPFKLINGLQAAFRARDLPGFIQSLADHFNERGYDISHIRVPMGDQPQWSLKDIAESEGHRDVVEILEKLERESPFAGVSPFVPPNRTIN